MITSTPYGSLNLTRYDLFSTKPKISLEYYKVCPPKQTKKQKIKTGNRNSISRSLFLKVHDLTSRNTVTKLLFIEELSESVIT